MGICLKSCMKNYFFDLDKVCHPKETEDFVKERIRKSGLNLFKELRRVDKGRLGIPIYLSITGPDSLLPQPYLMGKGSSEEQARVSALMELVERFSFRTFLPKRYEKGTYSNLDERCVDFDLLLRVPKLGVNYEDSAKSFLKELPFVWVFGLSLKDKKEYLIPYEWFAEIQGTNGLASGNTYEEAIIQGICEIVERDVCAKITSNKLSVPTVVFDEIKDERAKELVKRFHTSGIRFLVKDFSLDTNIPTIAVFAYDRNTFPKSEIVFCAGTATSPEKALIRALTEVQQMAIDDFRQNYYTGGILPKFFSLEEADYLINSEKKIEFSKLPNCFSKDIMEEIEFCTKSLDSLGIPLFVVDVTNEKLKIPTVFVIAPGATVLDNLDKDLNLYFYIGRRLSHLGKFEEAMNWYNESIVRYPKSKGRAYFYLGECAKRLKRFEDAIFFYKESLKHLDDLVLKRSAYIELQDAFKKR